MVAGDETGIDLAFYDKSKSKAVYRARFSQGQLVQSGTPSEERADLSFLEKRLIWAKDLALDAFLQAKVGLCSKGTPNLTPIPSGDPKAPIIVYLMTPQTDLKTYPLGGHYSLAVNRDGSLGKVRSFAKSCIAMPLDKIPGGSESAMFTVTHLLDPTPTEIHAFTSLASGIPIIVVTKDKKIWTVERGRIQFAREL